VSLLEIHVLGSPVLREETIPVTEITGDVRRLVEDMFETMRTAQGIGLAAPQVYRPLRLILFLDLDERDDAPRRPPIALINPEIERLGDAIVPGLEGCLSIPGLRGIVPRHAQIGYRGVTPDGKLIEREANGLHARVVQHEVDHLDGILYPMRMSDLRQLSFESELRHFAAADVEEEHSG
jgi:peptide deformylase